MVASENSVGLSSSEFTPIPSVHLVFFIKSETTRKAAFPSIPKRHEMITNCWILGVSDFDLIEPALTNLGNANTKTQSQARKIISTSAPSSNFRNHYLTDPTIPTSSSHFAQIFIYDEAEAMISQQISLHIKVSISEFGVYQGASTLSERRHFYTLLSFSIRSAIIHNALTHHDQDRP
jgi:hypothetical protein